MSTVPQPSGTAHTIEATRLIRKLALAGSAAVLIGGSAFIATPALAAKPVDRGNTPAKASDQATTEEPAQESTEEPVEESTEEPGEESTEETSRDRTDQLTNESSDSDMGQAQAED